jgi:hypothetical protein
MGSERRHYLGYFADSARWDALELRPGDVVVSTPSKSGTTWTQLIVAMLLHRSTELPAPLSELSPWVDAQVRSTDELVVLLDAQPHRRVLKTHTPLDGIPIQPEVTYLAVFRHPLDVALSDKDHAANMSDHVHAVRWEAVGAKDLDDLAIRPPRPDDPADHLRAFIDGPLTFTGAGPYSLVETTDQLRHAWARRDEPNVHLIHYADLLADLSSEMRRIAEAIDVEAAGLRWDDLVAAATFDSMRQRASDLAPEASYRIWHDDDAFFRQGGRRDWAALLTPEEIVAFEARTAELAGPDAAAWLLAGRAAGIDPAQA